MLKSPATRYGYSSAQKGDLGETESGYGESGMEYVLPTLKQGKSLPKQPCGVKTTNAMKASVSGGKKDSTANFSGKFRDI